MNLSKPLYSGATHLGYSMFAILILFISEFFIEYKRISVTDKNSLKIYSLCSVALLSLILGIGVFNGGQFIYFQF